MGIRPSSAADAVTSGAGRNSIPDGIHITNTTKYDALDQAISSSLSRLNSSCSFSHHPNRRPGGGGLGRRDMKVRRRRASGALLAGSGPRGRPGRSGAAAADGIVRPAVARKEPVRTMEMEA